MSDPTHWEKANANNPNRRCECGNEMFQVRYSGRMMGGAKYCGDCAVERARKAARNYWRNANSIAEGTVVTVECQRRYNDRCQLTFTYTRKKGGRLRTICDSCQKAHNGRLSSDWQKNNPDKVASNKRRHREQDHVRLSEREYRINVQRFAKYGVTKEWYESKLAEQGYKCGNEGCPHTEPGGRWNTWHIDHCHDTGIVRGLLCDRCNKSLGLLNDDPNVIRGLAGYADLARQLRLAV